MHLRPYQLDAVAAVYEHLRSRDDNPCVVIPTGGGKTPIIATICRDAVQQWSGRVLILAHVKELLGQAVAKLHDTDATLDIGVYSAGLKRRDTDHPIIVAGIQSVFRRAAELGRFDLIIVDEAHMIPPDGEGMYQTFLKDSRIINPDVRLIGLTATPYRTTTGTICAPDHLLNHVCYDVSIAELIRDGYLCKLRSKAGAHPIDTSSLHVRGGEFVAAEVEQLMNDETIVISAVADIVDHTIDRNAVLIFAAGVEHAEHIARLLRQWGYVCEVVTGDTPDAQRADTLSRFRTGQLKFLVNVNVLTTGFDAPNIDCVALLRPTMSPGLYYQMVGRGLRPHPAKADCLILDFGGNVLRHGPVDSVRPKSRNMSTEGVAPAKTCPACRELIAASYSTCPMCAHEFHVERTVTHDAEASDAPVLSGVVTDTVYDVKAVFYFVHRKKNAPDAPPTMRVDYNVGPLNTKSEWVCLEHAGYARHKAEAWWRKRTELPVPDSVAEAVQLASNGALRAPKTITVRHVSGEKYSRIIRYDLPPAEAVAQSPATTVAINSDDIPF